MPSLIPYVFLIGQTLLDGAFFGTTAAHLMFATMPELTTKVGSKTLFTLPKAAPLGSVGAPAAAAGASAGGVASIAVDPLDQRRESRRKVFAEIAAARRKRHRRRYAATEGGHRAVNTITHLRNPHPKHGWLSTVYAGPWPGAFRAKYDGEASSSSSSLSSWQGSDDSASEDGRPPPAKRPANAANAPDSHAIQNGHAALNGVLNGHAALNGVLNAQGALDGVLNAQGVMNAHGTA